MKQITRIIQSLFCLAILVYFSGCRATMHTVGTGGRGDCKNPGQYDKVAKQWYLFYGLMPIEPKIDSKTLVGDNTNYTIRTTTTFGDAFISGILSGIPIIGWIGAPRIQTIRVSYGNKEDAGKTNAKSSNTSSKLEALKSLKELLDSGAISKEEFEAEKSKILGN
jgi:hypothetical protein